jgi:hypothetical protein
MGFLVYLCLSKIPDLLDMKRLVLRIPIQDLGSCGHSYIQDLGI